MSHPRARTLAQLLLVPSLAFACAQGSDLDALDAPSGDAGSPPQSGAAGSTPLAPSAGGFGSGGSAGSGGSGGEALTSSSLDPNAGGGTGGIAAPACDYGATPTCDFTRETGCCSHLACQKASGANVFDTYPVESCQALLTCIQANPGCSSASDPLCFQDEAPTAPCLDEGYRASHTDPDGPFAWTKTLVECLCGY